jgi:hypothetical protein
VNSEPVNAYPTIRSLLLALLLIAFLFGVGHLFVLRFQTGDIYPPYSSLRSDPLGTGVFYESLENFGNITLGRNYRFLHSLRPEPGTTFFYLGASADDYHPVQQELFDLCYRLINSGGRLVVSFLPLNKTRKKRDKLKKEPESQNVENLEWREASKKITMVSMQEHWGVGFEFNQNLPVEDEGHPALNAVSQRQNLPPIISWHSNLYFDLLDSPWQVIYTSGGHPVMIERSFGKGSLVLSADSFFISNEALWCERQSQLLSWLLGPNTKIIFDEAHFGIYKQPSVAALLKHYRFHWAFFVLAVMALLFVWKNAVYFVPPRKDDLPSGADVVLDKDYTRGLIAMLRRNIPNSEILKVCGQEWERTFRKNKRIQPEAFECVKKMLRTQALSSKNKMDAVNGYRKVSRALQRIKKYE